MNSQPLVVRRPTWKEDYLALICGIANAGGGVLVVSNSNSKTGSRFKRRSLSIDTIPKLTRKELGLICTVEPVMDGDKLCLEISIPTPTEPISYKDSYYLYSNGSNTILDSATLEKLTNKDAAPSWELALQPFVNREDVDRDAISDLINIASRDDNSVPASLNGVNETSLDVADALSKLNIIDYPTQSLTNMGMLLVHSHPERFIAGSTIRVGMMDNASFNAHMSDEITGPLMAQLKKAADLIYDTYLPAIQEHSDKDIVLPPRAAIEEALLNALVHKDYESGVRIKVSVFEDRITIDNVGRPPQSWTVEDFIGHHNSRPNNPFLASTLTTCGKFTGWGGGIHKIQELCAKEGSEVPRFDIRTDEVTVTFPLIKTAKPDESAQDNTADTSASQGSAMQAQQTAMQNTTMQSQSGVSQSKAVGQFAKKSIAAAKNMDLTHTDEYILKVLAVNGRSTAPKIGELLGVSESTVRRSFKRLRGLGLIERVGSDKAGYWKVIL